MRLTACLLLMGILLFNWFGYQVLYNFLQQREDQHLESLLDLGKYNDDELITIKIPLFSPYISDQSEFRRVYGQVTVGGIPYQFVKSRVFHDSLTLLCIPEKEKLRLKDASDDYFKKTMDVQRPDNNKSKESHSKIKSLMGECYLKLHAWHFQYSPDPVRFTVAKQPSYTRLGADDTEHPPEYFPS